MTADRIENVIKNSLVNFSNNLHTAIPGTITQFNAETQLATIQPAIKTLLINSEEIDMPMLSNVPICFIRGGGFSFTQPVQSGDECLIIFCEKSIDRWKKDGAGFIANDSRKHSLSDAVACVFASSTPNAIPNFHTGGLEIKKDDDSVSIKLDDDGTLRTVSNKTEIINKPSGESLIALLKETLDVLSQTTVGGTTPIDQQADFSALAARVQQFIP